MAMQVCRIKDIFSEQARESDTYSWLKVAVNLRIYCRRDAERWVSRFCHDFGCRDHPSITDGDDVEMIAHNMLTAPTLVRRK